METMARAAKAARPYHEKHGAHSCQTFLLAVVLRARGTVHEEGEDL